MKKKLFILLSVTLLLFSLARGTQAASVKLFSSVSSLKLGEEIWLEVQLDTRGQETLGTDVILIFDPHFLEATGIEEGELYPSYPEKEFDNQRGRIYLSGVTGYGRPIDESGLLGRIGFRTKAAGETRVTFDWRAGETSESNVVPYEGNEDLLETEPDDFILTIKALSFWEKIIAFIKKIILP